MKKIIVILFLFIYPTNSIAHIGHYIKYNKIEMEIFRNGELIGYNHYFFNRNGSETIVTNQIKFVVKLLGATVFQVEGYSEEKYFKDQLVSYNSKTLQNDKKKFVNLTFDQKNKNGLTVKKMKEILKKIVSLLFTLIKLIVVIYCESYMWLTTFVKTTVGPIPVIGQMLYLLIMGLVVIHSSTIAIGMD